VNMAMTAAGCCDFRGVKCVHKLRFSDYTDSKFTTNAVLSK